MKQVVIKINTESDAFQPDPGPEVSALLFQLAHEFGGEGDDATTHAILDSNGNTVGKITVT